jgi:hypothetical protein
MAIMTMNKVREVEKRVRWECYPTKKIYMRRIVEERS